MNLELILKSVSTNPLLYIGLSGGAAMVCYLTAQSLALLSRQRYEKQANNLQLQALKKQIQILEQKAKASPDVAWNGWRKFKVDKKIEECEDTFSFYLTPHNGKALPSFKPGQYLTFQFSLPGIQKPFVRCYSLSDGFLSDDHYRVTIKRALPYENPKWQFDPSKIGIISSHFCDSVQQGDIIDVKAPSGHFYLDVEVDRPVILISGGIGVTPMLAMARYLTHIGDKREIHFFFGCRNNVDHMMREEMMDLLKTNPNVRMHVCYSRPLDTDRIGVDYNHKGRVTLELFKEILPSSNYEYYLCGPGPFMDSLVNGLYEWGVPEKDVKFEAFGPATVKKAAKTPAPDAGASSTAAGGPIIEFSKSGKSIPWDGVSTLLDFAEAQGITTIEGGCRAGSCGACLVAIKQGEINYDIEPGERPEEGSCLSCICKPKGKIVIDA